METPSFLKLVLRCCNYFGFKCTIKNPYITELPIETMGNNQLTQQKNNRGLNFTKYGIEDEQQLNNKFPIVAVGDIQLCMINFFFFLCIRVEKEVGGMEMAHEGMIWSLAWHPLGHILCSGSNDHTR